MPATLMTPAWRAATMPSHERVAPTRCRRASEMASPGRNPCDDGSHGFWHAFEDSGECVCIPPRFGGATSAVTSAGVHRGKRLPIIAECLRITPEAILATGSAGTFSRVILRSLFAEIVLPSALRILL